MALYLIIIGIAALVISTVVAIVNVINFFPVLAFTVLAVVLEIIINGLTATVSRLLPAKCANFEAKIFVVGNKEKKFYEKLKIRKWKDKVPEIGQLTGFRKNKIAAPKSLDYLDRFLLEIAYGEIGHFTSFFTSFLLLLFFPLYDLWFAVAIPVSIVGSVLNIPSFIILRYNSYKLRVLRNSALKKEQRAAQRQAAEAAPVEEAAATESV